MVTTINTQDDRYRQLREFLEKADKGVLLAELAGREDSPDGFGAFFELVFGMPLLPHQQEVVDLIYRAQEVNQGSIIEQFRGAAKTTTYTIAFAAFRVGHMPEGTSLLIQAGDDIAKDNSAAVAEVIAHNPGWKMAFPHIVPDIDAGWGAGGYRVKMTYKTRDMVEPLSYEDWTKMRSGSKDPTFIGLGYKSSSIIGKRPTNLLLLDDIHDEKNTRSDRELMTVKKMFAGTILPTIAPGAWRIIIGTPWNKRDIIATEKATGNYLHMKVPVIKQAGQITYHCTHCLTPNPQPVEPETKEELEQAPDGFCHNCGEPLMVEDTNVYTWPERFNRRELDIRRRSSGTVEYARMYLLDLEAAQNIVFSYFPYPYEQIDPTWRMVGGVDYAGTMDEARNDKGLNDYFAMAYVAVNENNVAVVVDGVVERLTQGRAEVILNRAQEMFPGWQYSVVEGDGKGEEFIQVAMRNPTLRIAPKKTGGKGKSERLERQLGPWLESGRVRISNAETPFLNELRAELDEYPNNDYDDAMDALYWALRGLPDVLFVREEEDGLPDFYRHGVRPRQENPYAGLF